MRFWLFPFGMLVIRSGFIPRVFGVLPMIAGVALLIELPEQDAHRTVALLLQALTAA